MSCLCWVYVYKHVNNKISLLCVNTVYWNLYQEKQVTITKPNGETTVTTVRIWNETVSNLTLMALGSSAPEILLSVIEVPPFIYFYLKKKLSY